MANEVKLHPSWLKHLEEEFHKPYFISLKNFLIAEKQGKHVIYPPGDRLFAALNETPFDRVKVVIIGQDPYHGAGQANGMSFSVNRGIMLPPSLKNIYKELESDMGLNPPTHGDLTAWAHQGVLLLNSVLTVRAGVAASHQNQGWETFTGTIISTINNLKSNVVFMLWGNFAKGKRVLIDSNKHFILEAAHPSPFSAYNGFLGCRHFSKANSYLVHHGLSPVDWKIN